MNYKIFVKILYVFISLIVTFLLFLIIKGHVELAPADPQYNDRIQNLFFLIIFITLIIFSFIILKPTKKEKEAIKKELEAYKQRKEEIIE